jgi:hypothetical protein
VLGERAPRVLEDRVRVEEVAVLVARRDSEPDEEVLVLGEVPAEHREDLADVAERDADVLHDRGPLRRLLGVEPGDADDLADRLEVALTGVDRPEERARDEPDQVADEVLEVGADLELEPGPDPAAQRVEDVRQPADAARGLRGLALDTLEARR